MRYNLYRSAQINATPATGYSSAQAMKAMEEVFAQTMSNEMGFAYMGMSYQEKRAQEGISRDRNFRLIALFRFPHSRRPVRKLVVAVQRSTERAYCRLRRVCWTDGRPLRKQYLRSDRPGHAHRSRSQERNPHRRVCQDET